MTSEELGVGGIVRCKSKALRIEAISNDTVRTRSGILPK